MRSICLLGVQVVASHAGVFRGARFFVGRDEKRAPLKTSAWEAIQVAVVGEGWLRYR